MWSTRLRPCGVVIAVTALASPLVASGPSLQEQIDELRAQYEARIEELEARVAELEAERAPTVARPAEDEIARLRAAAADAASAAPEPEPAAETRVATVGHERNLNRFNPEISFTGDVVGLSAAGEHDFSAREFELDFRSTLDPFSSTQWTIAYSEEEGVEVEEGYVRWTGLAPGVTLRAGKIRQSFGPLNRTHAHALPQTGYPFPIQAYFGEEGLVQTGLSFEWLLPRGWASANQLTVQLTDGSAEPFGGEDFESLVALARLTNFWDLSTSTYVEWGLSGAIGEPEDGRDATLWGTDLTLAWQPPSRAKYRELTWRTELLVSQRDDELGVERDAFGAYTYLDGRFARNWHAGVRFDHWEDPLEPDAERWALEPYLTWWQSEFVRLRAAYQYVRDELTDETEDGFVLQLTWAAGPHRHEAY